MSGYRNSGLTEQQYEDREVLRSAMEVIERRWPHGRPTVDLLRNWAEAIEEGNNGE